MPLPVVPPLGAIPPAKQGDNPLAKVAPVDSFGSFPQGIDKGIISGDVHWKIETVEPKNSPWKRSNFVVRGQFPVTEDGVKFNVTNVIGDAGGLGLAHPFTQWIRGEKQTISFTVVLFAEHNGHDIRTLFNQLLKLVEADTALGRPPVCKFTYGSILSVLVLVQGGEIQIRRARTDGKARHIVWPISLVRWVPYELEQALQTGPQKESRHEFVTEERRMYEILAAREFGTSNALFGDRLRKRNREGPFAALDLSSVKIPNADIILNEPVTPEFHAFDVNGIAAQQAMLNRIQNRKERFLVKNRR